jgi:4-hydroxybenzoate polyprenyltransferase
MILLVGYSYTKRFTWLCHYILGFTDGLAPMGAWVAVRGSLFTIEDLPAWILAVSVTMWIGGFDIIYACQDIEFDRQANIYSIPARFGIARGLHVAAASHILTIALLVSLGFVTDLAWPYWLGVGAITVMLVYEHSLIQPDDLSKLGVAFFNMNVYISITIFVATLAAVILA